MFYICLFQASTSLPQAILASEDPVSEEETVESATTLADTKVGPESVGPAEKKEKEVSAPREKSGGKVESKSSIKKSKNSYSIAALCQVIWFEIKRNPRIQEYSQH